MSIRRPRRLDDLTYIGLHAYSLTICCAERDAVLSRPECAEVTRDQLLRTAAAYRFALIADRLMPDHMHALVEGLAEDSDLCRFVSMFKQRSAFAWRRAGGGTLWQEGYYEHVVRDEQTYLPIAAYLLNNPIRAGLCRTVSEYPFLGSDRYTVEELAEAVALDPTGRRSRP